MSSKLNVLVVEDQPDDFFLLLRELKRGGLEVNASCVDTAQQMLESLSEHKWDLILCDYSLPQFDALSALRLAKQADFDGPFIIVSGQVGEDVAVRAMREGAHDYLMKNRLGRLCPAIERELRDARARREQREHQAALKESIERFKDLVENIKEVFWMEDGTGSKLLFVSPICVELWGKSVDSLSKNPKEWLASVHPEDVARVAEAKARLRKGERYDEEYRIVRPDSSIRWVRDRGWQILDEHGVLTRIAGLVEDITEQREAEEALRTAQKMEALGRLAGGVAHDFNNLLTTIIGYSELIKTGLPDESHLKADVEVIHKAGEKAAALTRQLLAFSKTQIVETRVLNLNQVINGLFPILDRLLGEDIKLVKELEPTLRNVRADQAQLEQVVLNLAVNSRDAMPGGGTLTIRTQPTDPDTHGFTKKGKNLDVCLSVLDTGCGMTEETLKRIFDPFFTTKAPDKGTGLGLATVHGIVDQHGGVVHVLSKLGEGSEFRVFFPSVKEIISGPRVTKISNDQLRGNEQVLLVDEETTVCNLVRAALEVLGYRITAAENPLRAIEILENDRTQYDLLLTDLVMPDMNGLELAMKARAYIPGLKVLFMSGYPGDLLNQHGLSEGHKELINKPVLPSELARRIRMTLDGRM